MLIRQAKAEDIPTLKAWMAEFLQQALPYKEVDHQHIENLLEDGLTTQVILVAEVDNTIRGTIIGVYTPHPLNPAVSCLSELAWWVPKEWRKTRVGWVLLQAFAGLKRTDITTMSLLPSSAVAPKHLNKLGFQASEVSFVKDNRS